MFHKGMRLLFIVVAGSGLLPAEGWAAEPLPPRALARLGDHRFYHGPTICGVALTRDGQFAASAAAFAGEFVKPATSCGSDDPFIVIWNAATGERLRELRVPQGTVSRLAFSPDGKRLAASCDVAEDRSVVVLFDVESGKVLRRLSEFHAAIRRVQFSADGKQLWVSESGGPVTAWEAASGKRLRTWQVPIKTPSNEAKAGRFTIKGVLSPDGRILVWEMGGFSRQGCWSVWTDGLRVQDAETNKLLYYRKFADEEGVLSHDGVRSYAFTADGKRLAVDRDRFVVWETASGKEQKSIRAPSLRRFALTPDGRRAAIEEAGTRANTSRLRLWDVETGKPIRELFSPFEDRERGVQRLLPVFSGDGRTLLIATESTLRFFDGRTGEERTPPAHRSPILLRFSADGRTLVTTCAERRRRWDLSEKKPTLLCGERRKTWEDDSLIFSADGQFFVDRPADECIRVRETASGRVLHELHEYACVVALSPEGTRLLLSYQGRGGRVSFRLHDLKSDKKSGEITRSAVTGQPIFSPNGQLLAWMDGEGNVHLHDAATGKVIRTLRSAAPLPPSWIANLRVELLFSSDGELLIVAASHCLGLPEGVETQQLPTRIFQVSSGREIHRFYANPDRTSRALPLTCLACSPDGRLLAVAETDSGIVRLLEMASGKVRCEFAGHRHGVHGLTFAPDGKTLASGGEDNVVFVWDVIGARTPAASPEREIDLPALWNDLASEDGKRAGVVLAALLRKPAMSVAFLREKLRSAGTVDPRRLTALIADLDADAFEKREMASRELVLLNKEAEATLRRELTNRPSLEMRRRIEDILDKLEPSPPPAETLRLLRAIEVLEHSDTAEARRCLEVLAKGATEARQTRDAKAALQRLAKHRE